MGAAIGTAIILGPPIAKWIWDLLFANENNKEGQPCEVPPSPPDGLVENPDRPGSWGEYDDKGKFQEKWRHDKARPEVKKGHGSQDHIHIDGSKKWYPVK